MFLFFVKLWNQLLLSFLPFVFYWFLIPKIKKFFNFYTKNKKKKKIYRNILSFFLIVLKLTTNLTCYWIVKLLKCLLWNLITRSCLFEELILNIKWFKAYQLLLFFVFFWCYELIFIIKLKNKKKFNILYFITEIFNLKQLKLIIIRRFRICFNQWKLQKLFKILNTYYIHILYRRTLISSIDIYIGSAKHLFFWKMLLNIFYFFFIWKYNPFG